jgi:phosphoglucomutase
VTRIVNAFGDLADDFSTTMAACVPIGVVTTVCVRAVSLVGFTRLDVAVDVRANVITNGFVVATSSAVEEIGSRFRFVGHLRSFPSTVVKSTTSFLLEGEESVGTNSDGDSDSAGVVTTDPQPLCSVTFNWSIDDIGRRKFFITQASSFAASIARSSCPNDLCANVTAETINDGAGPNAAGSL